MNHRGREAGVTQFFIIDQILFILFLVRYLF